MKSYRIVWRPDARADIFALYDWIAEQADADVAFAYTSKIEAHARKLAHYPDRGTRRNDIVAGLRTVTFRRRTIIAYRVLSDEVEILRVMNTSMDLTGIFADE